jgi:sarcosine oxidase subunit alpha
VTEDFPVIVNGRPVLVSQGTSVASAIIRAGVPSRYSISGQPRAPLCGMGICFECRAMVNGELHVKTCQTVCIEGMEIFTDA